MEATIREIKKEYEALLKASIETTKTIMFVSFARLFAFSTDREWKDTKVLGAIAVVMDRVRKSAFIQIYNPDKHVKPLELIFECELYYNFSQTFSKLSWPENNTVSFVFHQRYFALELPSESQLKFFISAVKGIEETEKDPSKLKALLKEQEKRFNKANKKGGFFSGIKKIFKGKKPKKDTEVKNFKRNEGISVNKFIVETSNVSGDMKEAYVSHINDIFKQSGIKSKYLKQPGFRKEVEEILQTHSKEEQIRMTEATNDDSDEEEKRSQSIFVKPKEAPGNIPPPPPPPSGFKPSNPKKTTPSENTESEADKPSIPTPSASPSKTPPPPPPPGIKGKTPPPPPPPSGPGAPPAAPNPAVLRPNAGPRPTDKRFSAQPQSLLEQLQQAKLKPVTKKTQLPKEDDTLQGKLQQLLAARREELEKNKGSSDSDDNYSSSDSSGFD